MSGDSAELRNASKIIAGYGPWCSMLYSGGTAASQDLSLLGQTKVDPDLLNDILSNVQSSSNPAFAGLLGRYVRFTFYSSTSGAFAGLMFGASSASVTGGNAPVLPTGTSSILATTGNPTTVPGDLIPSLGYIDVWISVNTRWLGWIPSAAGYLLVRPSSVGANG